jgi:hypothetical protein
MADEFTDQVICPEMSLNSPRSNIGIGATDELSLRVSVATLVRALFENPHDGELMLALEHKATLLEDAGSRFVNVKAQPFGGAIRIHHLKALQDLLIDFHFDSEQSRSEQDFRLFIRPSDWEMVRQFCLHSFRQVSDPKLESDPRRELVEEFHDALNMDFRADQFSYKPVGIVVENDPSPTDNSSARGCPTVRIYRIFESRLSDTTLINAILTNSKSQSNEILRELALEDERTGGRGWANAVLTLSANEVKPFYLAVASQDRDQPVLFQGHRLDETVAAIFEDIPVPKYQRLQQ